MKGADTFNSIIREEIDQRRKTKKKGSTAMTNDASRLPLCVNSAQPSPSLRYGPPGDPVQSGGADPLAISPATEDSMSITHYRVVSAREFADALGLADEAHDRHPHSPVRQGVTNLYNVEGQLIGRIRLAWTAEGYCIPDSFMLPSASTSALEAIMEPWL